MISVVIPSYNRVGILKKTLQEYNYQTLDEFEIIVVNDGGEEITLNEEDYRYPIKCVYQENAGPGAARNRGVRESSYEIIHFVGDDTIPERNLLFRHWYNHRRDGSKKAVQGYTQWHPSIASDPFHVFLDATGLQANWQNLKQEDGSWKYEANGYCLTTNYSIHKTEFYNAGGFNEDLAAAAWDDISLGYRVNNQGIRTVFDPGAMNYHFHHYDLESFVKRQMMEGYWRLTLCFEFPEVASNLIPPDGLREARNSDLQHAIRWANELKYASGEDIIEAQYNRWHRVLRMASLKGILNRIDDDHPALKAIEHMHKSEQVLHVINGVAGIKRGDLAYAQHCVGWLLGVTDDNWASHAFAGEIFLESDDVDRAKESFRQSIKQSPNDWSQERLEELG
jgi:glycosyltransferase involved in cell wall biosynthesis